MDLEALLATLVGNVDGALGAALGGLDGLLVEGVVNEADLDLGAVVAEHANLVRGARSAYGTTLAAGEVAELVVAASRQLGYVRAVNSDLFLVLVLEPRGNLGKARLLSERLLPQLQEALG